MAQRVLRAAGGLAAAAVFLAGPQDVHAQQYANQAEVFAAYAAQQQAAGRAENDPLLKAWNTKDWSAFPEIATLTKQFILADFEGDEITHVAQAMDLDRDGKITKAEVLESARLSADVQSVEEKEIMDMFLVDMQQDVAKLFDEMDSDGDGFLIGETEQRAMVEGMKDKFGDMSGRDPTAKPAARTVPQRQAPAQEKAPEKAPEKASEKKKTSEKKAKKTKGAKESGTDEL